MIARLRLWYWRRRLAWARDYRRGIERIMVRETAKAQYDLEYCVQRVREAQMAAVVARADRALAGKS